MGKIPTDLDSSLKACSQNESCGNCNYLNCDTFQRARTEHLKNKFKATQESLNKPLTPQEIAFKQQETEDIINALAKLRDSSYGSCKDCSQMIPKARLDHLPDASRCVTCQEKHEKKLIYV